MAQRSNRFLDLVELLSIPGVSTIKCNKIIRLDEFFESYFSPTGEINLPRSKHPMHFCKTNFFKINLACTALGSATHPPTHPSSPTHPWPPTIMNLAPVGDAGNGKCNSLSLPTYLALNLCHARTDTHTGTYAGTYAH